MPIVITHAIGRSSVQPTVEQVTILIFARVLNEAERCLGIIRPQVLALKAAGNVFFVLRLSRFRKNISSMDSTQAYGRMS